MGVCWFRCICPVCGEEWISEGSYDPRESTLPSEPVYRYCSKCLEELKSVTEKIKSLATEDPFEAGQFLKRLPEKITIWGKTFKKAREWRTTGIGWINYIYYVQYKSESNDIKIQDLTVSFWAYKCASKIIAYKSWIKIL